MVDPVEDGVAVELCTETGTEKESSGEFAVERVALVRGRSQTVVEEDWDQSLDLQRGLLVAKVKQTVVFEWLSEDE